MDPRQQGGITGAIRTAVGCYASHVEVNPLDSLDERQRDVLTGQFVAARSDLQASRER